jgi:hypothetical protein
MVLRSNASQHMPAFRSTTAEAVEALRISAATLRRLRKEGTLKPGQHFRAAGGGMCRPQLLWNIESCDQALAQRSRRVLSP